MKKIILSLLLLIILVFLGTRTYWYFKAKQNNLIIFISNQTGWITENNSNSITVDIYMDDKLLYKNDSLINFYNHVRKRVNVGKHKLTIVIDSCYTKTEYIFVLPLKWILIEYPHTSKTNPILVTTNSSPPKLE